MSNYPKKTTTTKPTQKSKFHPDQLKKSVSQKQSEKSTDWGKVADWYDQMISDTDSYQNQVILPNLLKSINIQKDQTILDLGCGVGYFCQKYLDRGAKVIGVDSGVDSIELAKTKTNPAIEYHCKNAEKLSFLANCSVDKITIILAIQNISKADQCLSECARVLKPKGELIIVLNHPYFRIPKSTSWVWSDREFLQYRRIDSYMTPFATEIEMRPSARTKLDKVETVSFHRPLEWFIQHNSANGLLLKDMQELISHRTTDQGPKKTPKLEFARQEIPLFMLLKWVKV